MELRRTPQEHDLNRRDYEEAYSSGDLVVQKNIELNTMIRSVQSLMKSPDRTIEQFLEAYKATIGYAIDIMTNPPLTSKNFTDFHRLMHTATFVGESIQLPLLFGTNTKEIQKYRKELTNGNMGKSLDLADATLTGFTSFENLPSDEASGIRGGIQEDTIAALLNEPEDGHFAVLPSTYHEDRHQSIDLHAYFIANDGQGYMAPISVKTSQGAAKAEKVMHPELIVLSGEQINNQGLEVTRLLIREFNGHPGISAKEKTVVRQARATLYASFCEQVAQTHLAKPVPRQSAQRLINFQRAA